MAEEHNSYTQDPESKPTDKLDIALKAFVALSSFYDKIPSVMRLTRQWPRISTISSMFPVCFMTMYAAPY